MTSEKYIIFLDILGFRDLPHEIAAKLNMEERKVRSDLMDTINQRLQAAEEKGEILGKVVGTDDWILAVESLDLAFKIISEVLDHNTGYKGYPNVPLEIGIGSVNYDRWAKFNGKDLVCETETIDLLKTNLIKYYHKWHEETKGSTPRSTFIIITDALYKELEPLDGEKCERVEYLIPGGIKNKGALIRFFVTDVGGVRQRGRVFEFLEKIGRSGSRFYDRIDDLYIPPVEYYEIKRTLEKNKVVFITGSPEFGKTYTAVRLLWEYYNRGYEPIWKGGAEKEERRDARKALENIGMGLKGHRILYFEDPFGIIEYESRDSLKRDIGMIIKTIRGEGDALVILTSREEVFKQFRSEHLPPKELEKFERKLNIKRQSYDYERRKKMLLMWSKAKACCWRYDANLVGFVLGHLRNPAILPTPLSIRDFVGSTVNTTKVDELMEQLNIKSEITAMRFATEIEKMSTDKIVFLIYLLILHLPVKFVREEYARFMKEVNLEEEPWEFDRVLDWFKDDEVDFIGPVAVFSHPSYGQAVILLLAREDQLSQTNRKIIDKILFGLAGNSMYAAAMGQFLEDNFQYLSEDLRNRLLIKMADMCEDEVGAKYAGDNVASTIVANLDDLPAEIKSIFLKLSKNVKTMGSIAKAIAKNFDIVPDDFKSLLFKLCDDTNVGTFAGDVADGILWDFHKLSKVLKELFFKLCAVAKDKSDLCISIIFGFGYHPKRVRNLIFEFAEEPQNARIIAMSIFANFGRLPSRVRDLLFKVYNKIEDHMDIALLARVILVSYYSLPDDVRNLLPKLAGLSKDAFTAVEKAVTDAENLPNDFRGKLLRSLSDKGERIIP